jgi:cytoskeletal protein CcmA (bactofilin family)
MNVLSKKPTASTITLLDKGCEFDGKLSFEGIVRIDGVFHGEIFSHDHLIIGEGAVVEANIQVGEVEIGGTFRGNITAKGRVTIHSTGKVQAKLVTQEFEVHKGAIFDGNVEMGSAHKTGSTGKADELSIVHFNQKNTHSS